MNRKLRLFMLILMLTLFAHGTVYAADEKDLGADAPAAVETSVSPDTTEGKDEQSPIPTATEETKSATSPEKDIKPTEGEATSGEANAVDEAKAPEDHKGGETNATTKEKAAAPLMEKAATTPSESEKATENGTSGKNEESTGEKKPEGKTEKPVEDKNQVEPSEDLKKLGEQIKAEKDDKKKAELQKEYNEKYLKEVEKSASGKLTDDMDKRLTDKEKIARYNQIKEKRKEIEQKIADGKLTQKDVDELNKLLGGFEPPRALTDEEKAIRKDLATKPYINIDEKNSSKEGKKIYEDYKKVKDALDKALNPDQDGLSKEELGALGVKDLQELKKKFDDLNKQVLDGINSTDPKKKIAPAFGEENGDPRITVYPFDFTGGVGGQLQGDTYYVPDNTPLDLLVQVGKNNDGNELTLTITPNKVGNPLGENPKADLNSLVFLNGKAVELTANEDGSYSFTTAEDFGVAQLKFQIPGFYGNLHEGFSITMKAGEKTIKKNFLITKKGYDDNPEVGGIGSIDPKKPEEFDGGNTTDGYVNDDTDEVANIFTLLKKSNGYIDDVIVNSSNGESLPLSHVKITMKLPKYNDKFAEYIHKSGLKYHKVDDGTYVLEIEKRNFKGNLKGKDPQKLTQDELKKLLLDDGTSKKYVDEKGEVHDVKDVLQNGDFKVDGKTLYKKDGENFKEVGTFDDKGKLTKDGTTYILQGDKLLSYTSEEDVYEGNVANKDGKADTNVTPTLEGKQVTVESEVNGEKKTSFGGTIVGGEKGAIFDSSHRFKQIPDKDFVGVEKALVDSSGKLIEGKTYNDADIKTDDKGNKTVTIDGVEYKIKENAVFNEAGYLLSGYTFRPGEVLVDQYGRLMEDITVKNEDGNYSFTKKGKAPNVTFNVSEAIDRIFVNNNNYVVKNDGYKAIVGKYYYDKENNKFVEAKDGKVIGDKFFAGYKELKLDPKLSYGESLVPDDATKLYGSLDSKDYYKVGDAYYVKKTLGEGDKAKEYYVRADGKKDDLILSKEGMSFYVQKLGDEERIVSIESIFDAVNNAKFGLRFPGFLTGKDIGYTLTAEFQASYERLNDKGETEEVSIFKNEEGKQAATKVVNRYFYLKEKSTGEALFFKNAPSDLSKNLDYNFFNIFYRDGSDRQRDQYIIGLLEKEDKAKQEAEEKKKGEAKADDAKELTEEEKQKAEDAKAALEKELKFLELLRRELKKLDSNAKFEIIDKDGEKTLSIVDDKGKALDLDRSLRWTLGFNNKGGGLFPKYPNASIIVEDHNMDNRLIYDEVIINDTKENWDDAKKTWEGKEENKDKEFPGTDQYFFLDQLDKIRLGINPNYVESYFVAVDGFEITSKEIKDTLGDNQKVTLTKNGVDFEITRDSEKGQIRIKVLKAFYKENDTDDKSYKFSSPVQEAYTNAMSNKIAPENLNSDTKENLKNSFDTLLKKVYKEGSPCYNKLSIRFDNLLKKVDENTKEGKAQLKKIQESMIRELNHLKLSYLDGSKVEYHHDDMRFNAIQFELKPGTTIGGATDQTKSKIIGITSVINPMVDIPFTDEFGHILTNKDKYVKEEIQKILDTKDDNFKKNWNKQESSYREVIEKAFANVNAMIDKNEIVIKDLATFDPKADYKEKLPYSARKGSDPDFSYGDLATGEGEKRKSLKDSKGNPINPYYVGDGESMTTVDKNIDANLEKYKGKIDVDKFKASQAYQDLINPSIDLAAYYMSNQGYDRNVYKNFADYRLSLAGQGPGLFEKDSHWKNKVCPSGIGLGHCIEKAGEDAGVEKEDGADGKGTSGAADAGFKLVYEPSVPKPEEENPKFDKTSETKELDLSKDGKDKEGKGKDITVDFTVKVKVDKLNTTQKIAGEALKPSKDDKTVNSNYNENGYYVYKNSLIIDFLPDIFQLQTGSQLTLKIDEDAMKQNGANKTLNMEEFQKKAKPLYVENIYDYVKTLDKNQREVLEAAIEKAETEGKLKKGKLTRAILAWLPEFEAPHGDKAQFTLSLKNLLVDKKKYQESEAKQNKGQKYTNRAVFGNVGEFFYSDHTIPITDGHKGKVNKYLRIYDEEGNPVKESDAGEWFKGYTTLHFGDKFDYKINYTLEKPLTQTDISSNRDQDWSLTDDFSRMINKGLRPVLRDFVEEKDGFKVTYKIGEKSYSKSELEALIKEGKAKLADVKGITITNEYGYPIGQSKEFILPMMIPEFDAKIEDGKVVYIGTDGKKHELGKAEDFFNLDNLVDKDKDLSASNKVEGSNTVTVYLEKERFIKLYKEFFEADGTTEIKENRPEVKFNIVQIVKDKDGNVIERKTLDKQLVLNEKNKFVDKVDGLPLFKKITTVNEDGSVSVKTLSYTYEVEEVAMDGYTGKVFKFDEDDKLGFVFKAKNTKKPETPPETPPEEPKTPPEEPKNPPEEPKTPPEEPNTPPETPETPDKPGTPDKPNKPNRPNKPNKPVRPGLPKTGVADEGMLLLASGGLLLALLAYRRKYAVK